MNYLSVVAWTPEGIVWKHQEFDTLEEAKNHASSVADNFPLAFACTHPGVSEPPYWIADPAARTITYDANAKAAAREQKEWKQAMSASDKEMPRWFEDYIANHDITLTPGRTKANYDAKLALRGNKPN